MRVQTQFKITFNGVSGFDYASVISVANMYSYDLPSVFEDLQIMEVKALELINKETQKIMAKFDVVIAAKTVGEQGIKRLGNSMQGVQGKVKNLKLAVTGLNGALKIFAGVLAAGAFTRFVKGL